MSLVAKTIHGGLRVLGDATVTGEVNATTGVFSSTLLVGGLVTLNAGAAITGATVLDGAVTVGGSAATSVLHMAHNVSAYPWTWTATGDASLKLIHFMDDFVTFATTTLLHQNVTAEKNLIVDGILTVDVIDEKTTDAGVTVESVLLKDGTVVFGGDVTFSRTNPNQLLIAANSTTFTGTGDTTYINFGHNNSGNYPFQWTVNANVSLNLKQYLTDMVTFYATGAATIHGATTIEDLAGTDERLIAVDAAGLLKASGVAVVTVGSPDLLTINGDLTINSGSGIGGHLSLKNAFGSINNVKETYNDANAHILLDSVRAGMAFLIFAAQDAHPNSASQGMGMYYVSAEIHTSTLDVAITVRTIEENGFSATIAAVNANATDCDIQVTGISGMRWTMLRIS